MLEYWAGFPHTSRSPKHSQEWSLSTWPGVTPKHHQEWPHRPHSLPHEGSELDFSFRQVWQPAGVLHSSLLERTLHFAFYLVELGEGSSSREAPELCARCLPLTTALLLNTFADRWILSNFSMRQKTENTSEEKKNEAPAPNSVMLQELKNYTSWGIICAKTIQLCVLWRHQKPSGGLILCLRQ